MNYDTSLFIEIIESINGVTYLRQSDDLEVHIRFYQGLKGNLVTIDCSYEDITPNEGVAYLRQLGVEHLIPALFPEIKKTKIDGASPE